MTSYLVGYTLRHFLSPSTAWMEGQTSVMSGSVVS